MAIPTGDDKICARCGKEFIKAPFHIYKIKRKSKIDYYCSYTCYLRAQEEKKSKYKIS